MKMPDPVAWMYDFTITGEDEVYTNWLTQDPTEVGKEAEGIRNVRALYSADQLHEALTSHEAVIRMALKCLKNSNAVSFDDLHAIKALEEQLK